MTLFEHRRQEEVQRIAPLATRMRPARLEEFVGQEHLVADDRVLRKAIEADRVPSMILWGPPGSGKTTLARLIAHVTEAHFETISAVTSGVAEVRRVVSEARARLGEESSRTILLIDEIHRFNKSQQDALLPHVEDGTLTLIGATTENPSFEVIGPLLSRTRVFTLNALSDDDLNTLIDRALADEIRGLAALNAVLDDDARTLLLTVSNGDARIALNSLEFATQATEPDRSGARRITRTTLEDALQRQAKYDKDGDAHYDTISAFIKSVRSSDPDAAVYWLARMVDAGEDPVFIARRLVILAAEDVGLADPGALNFAVACQQGVHLIGMPEARILLAQATVYLASAPKSNRSYVALNRAMGDVRAARGEAIPMHLRNAATRLMEEMGYGEGYKYAHDYEGAFAKTHNLPENLRDRRYYFPGEQGYEPLIRERLERWWGERYRDRIQPRDQPSADEDRS